MPAALRHRLPVPPTARTPAACAAPHATPACLSRTPATPFCHPSAAPHLATPAVHCALPDAHIATTAAIASCHCTLPAAIRMIDSCWFACRYRAARTAAAPPACSSCRGCHTCAVHTPHLTAAILLPHAFTALLRRAITTFATVCLSIATHAHTSESILICNDIMIGSISKIMNEWINMKINNEK